MNPTEHNDPLQQGNQASSEQQSSSEGEGNTQVTQSDSSPSTPEQNAAPQPPQSQQEPGFNIAPPPYHPSTNERTRVLGRRMVFLAPPPYTETPQMNTGDEPVASGELLRIGGNEGTRIFISNTDPRDEQLTSFRELPRMRSDEEHRIFISDTDSDYEERRRACTLAIANSMQTSSSVRRARRIRRVRELFFQMCCLVAQTIFYILASVLLIDSILGELDALQLVNSLRNGTLCNADTNTQNPITEKTCHLHGASSISLKSASVGNSTLPWTMLVLKIICFPALLIRLLIPLICPIQQPSRHNHSRRPSSENDLELEELIRELRNPPPRHNQSHNLQEEHHRTQNHNQGNNRQHSSDSPEEGPSDDPSGELEDASSSQSNSRERN